MRGIALNSVISAGARLFGTALALVITGFITRYLGRDGYGNYATIIAFLYIFTVFADFGLYSITVRDISRRGVDEEKIVSNTFTLRLLIGLCIFLIGSLVVYLFPYPIQLKIGLFIGAVGFWFLSNIQLLMGVFQKYLKMARVAIAEVSGRILQLGLVLFFIKSDYGFLSVVGALSFGALLNFSLTVFFARKYVKFGLGFDFAYWRRILKESLPLAAAVIFVTLYFKLDTVMLSLMKSAEDVGIYGLAYKIMENLVFFPHMFVGLVMPLLSRYIYEDWKNFKNIFQKSFDVLVIFVLPIIVGVVLLSPQIITLIGGSDFLISAKVLNILALSCAFIFFGALFSNVIIARKKQKYLTWIYGAGALFNLGANFIFIPRYSYYGAAWTTVFTELLVTILMLVIIYKFLKFYPSFEAVNKSVLSVILMGAVVWLLSGFNLIIPIVSGAVVYFVILYLVGGIKKKDINGLLN